MGDNDIYISVAETKIIKENKVNTMATNDLVTLCCQVINNHGIDYARYTSPCVPQARILTTFATSMLRNDRICPYNFIVHQLNAAP